MGQTKTSDEAHETPAASTEPTTAPADVAANDVVAPATAEEQGTAE